MPYTGILGQDNSIALLSRTLAAGKSAHAYLFSGIEGCGKKMTALAFIEAVFCGASEGCGICQSCRKVAALQHPDLHLVEPDGAYIKIDQIRELQRNLAFRPFEASKKACIIDGAERLNPAAGNALLKTLEEPPGDALLILITANPDGVLPTVLSRCQRLHFAALSETAIDSILRERGSSPEVARIVATLADGSLGKAFEIREETALIERKGFLEKVGNLSLGEITPLFAMAEELAGDKENTLELLGLLTAFLRDALLIRCGDSRIVNTDLMPLVELEAARYSGNEIMEMISHVSETRAAISGNVNTRLALDVLFMRLAKN